MNLSLDTTLVALLQKTYFFLPIDFTYHNCVKQEVLALNLYFFINRKRLDVIIKAFDVF